MKVKGLSRYYDQLSVLERIRLLFAARARRDEPDANALLKTAPLRTWQLPEHLLTEQALHILALIYVGEQLEAASQYFFNLWRLEDSDEPDPDELLKLAQAEAYFFTANADAWRRFCTDLGVSAEELTAANHNGWFLGYCLEHMPANTPSAETISAWGRKPGQQDSQIVTSDDLLESWQKAWRGMTGS